jgi:hypothetical protein
MILMSRQAPIAQAACLQEFSSRDIAKPIEASVRETVKLRSRMTAVPRQSGEIG